MALILVIEDNVVNLELMCYLLQAYGHRTQSAMDGATGLARARRETPALVVCDLQMPVLDGYGVATAMRADPALRAVPLVAVSAAAMVGDRERALAAGFDAHIAKPIDPQTFVPLVQGFLHAPAPVPAASDTGASLGRAQVPAELRAPRPGLVLLMVDDKPGQLEFKRELLEPAGYAVQTAGDAEAAWALLQAAPFDGVVSDVVMPGDSGFMLLQRVRADPRLHGLPFLFLTSTACDSASIQQALAMGADAYLMRPMDPQVLLRELRKALGFTPASGRRR